MLNKIKIFSLCLFSKLSYLVLQKIFGFDKWHINGAFWCREYKREVASLIEEHSKLGVIELGCGLGELSNKLSNKKFYIGIDSSASVINAAKFLNKLNSKTFKSGFFHEISINFSKYDLFVCVNMAHDFSPTELVTILNSVVGGVDKIILDFITTPNDDEYNYKHNIDNLKKAGLSYKSFEVIKSFDEHRDIAIIQTK